jgi:hypothetical protein
LPHANLSYLAQKIKSIYSEAFKDGELLQSHVVSRLLDGIPEDRLFLKDFDYRRNLKYKQITLGSKDLHEGK